jgi:hypothetical protein
MPEASLLAPRLQRTPLGPSDSGRAKFDSELLSADVSVGSGEKRRNSISLHWADQKISTALTSQQTLQTRLSISPSIVKSRAQDMAAVASGETRPNKVSSSTNNLFSSSCQPMRNTPSGDPFAKVSFSLICPLIF